MWPDGRLGGRRLATGDWRLPNIKELQSLIDFGQHAPALPVGHPFSGVQGSICWSSTNGVDVTYNAWTVRLDYGNVAYVNKGSILRPWPVRGGQ